MQLIRAGAALPERLLDERLQASSISRNSLVPGCGNGRSGP